MTPTQPCVMGTEWAAPEGVCGCSFAMRRKHGADVAFGQVAYTLGLV